MLVKKIKRNISFKRYSVNGFDQNVMAYSRNISFKKGCLQNNQTLRQKIES